MTPQRKFIFLSIVLCIAFRVWVWRETNSTLEDALITLRYVEQLAAGEGFVYNKGEHVQGTTTPLWTLLLTTIKVTTHSDLFTASKVLGILLDAATVMLMVSLLWRINVVLAIIFATLFVSSPTIAPISVSGMETPLVLFSMSLAFWGFTKENFAFSIGLALLLLTRIDGAIFATVMLAVSFFSDRRWAMKQLLIVALACLPWFIFAQLYFGSVIPQSALAKSAVYDVDVGTTLKPIINQFTPFAEASAFRFLLKSVLLLPIVIGIFSSLRKWRVLFPFPLFFCAYGCALTFSGVLIFGWYLIPMIFASYVLFAVGAMWMSELFLAKVKTTQRLIIILLVAPLLTTHIILLSGRVQSLREVQAFEENVRKEIGLWLNKNAAKGSTVFLEPLGYVGYYAGREINMRDEIGLVAREVVTFRTTREDWYVHALQQMRPDYVVQYAYTLEHNSAEGTQTKLFSSAADRVWFDDNFQPAVTFDVSDQYPILHAKKKKNT